jgi:predicted thioesterase
MSFDIEKGTKGYQELMVSVADTASAFSSGLVEVYATPAMIALMEKTCQLSVQPSLPEGFITVGTLVNIRHLKATPVGMTVTCESELVEQEGKKLVFKLVARDEQGVIGDGMHERYIVEVKSFMSKISGK